MKKKENIYFKLWFSVFFKKNVNVNDTKCTSNVSYNFYHIKYIFKGIIFFYKPTCLHAINNYKDQNSVWIYPFYFLLKSEHNHDSWSEAVLESIFIPCGVRTLRWPGSLVRDSFITASCVTTCRYKCVYMLTRYWWNV